MPPSGGTAIRLLTGKGCWHRPELNERVREAIADRGEELGQWTEENNEELFTFLDIDGQTRTEPKPHTSFRAQHCLLMTLDQPDVLPFRFTSS
eukprot:2161128-Rhodomonas_salina.3